MTAPCVLRGCPNPADLFYVDLAMCARHYKREAEWADATPERQTEIRAEVARLQGQS